MFSFVQNLLAPKSNPIGVDYGSDCLRMIQVQRTGTELKLIAAASADVPPHVRHDPNARLNFFVETTKELLAGGKFRGRQVVLGLPAASMFIQHLRMPKLDNDAMKKALPWELRGKLPIDPSHAQLRHIVAGDVYEGQEPKSEVIVIAAAKEMVNQYLAAAAKAKLDVVGMNVEPRAMVDCFSQIYRRKSDEGAVSCYVDIGAVATRAIIAKGTDILFARVISVGGDHFSRATANTLKMKLEDAKVLRVKLASQAAPAAEEKAAPAPRIAAVEAEPEQSIENSFALLPRPGIGRRELDTLPTAAASAAVAVAEPEVRVDPMTAEARKVEMACREPLNRLVEELELCRRYYETTFPSAPVDRLIFVGGEARQKSLCQQIARTMGLAAQVGDPMVRLNKNADIPADSGIDPKQPQPGWAVAIGLSIGAAVESTTEKKA